MKKAKAEKGFRDLLIPILLILCIMPFVVYLAEYDFGYGKYTWHSDYSIAQDLYAYYRSYFFVIVAIFGAIVMFFYLALYADKRKNVKIFIPLVVYMLMVILSTICSVNKSASLSGNYYQFQSMFVLLGYVIMCFYSYQIMEKEQDYKCIFHGILIVFAVLAIVGIFQLFKMDLLNFRWAQRLIMSKEQYDVYGGELQTIFTGNNVFLTLFNPNYAGVYLTMVIGVMGVMAYSETRKKQKIWYILITLMAFVFMWYTYSRATLISVTVGLVVFLLLLGKKNIHKGVKYAILVIFSLLIVLIIADGWNGFKYMSRMVDMKKDGNLESILTKKDGVYVTYDETTYQLCMEEERIIVYDEKEGLVNLSFSEDAIVTLIFWEEEPLMYLQIGKYEFAFGFNSDGYYYYTENGKNDQLVEIKKVDFHGLEYLGSGRLYIWSRTIPLLSKYLLIGSGPDTFAEVFPQNDYVGKVVYADTGTRIMERPHNDFLSHWVQTGGLSLLSLLAFNICFIRKCFKKFQKSNLDSWKERLGCGCFIGCICYFVSCIFNDGTLYTSPIFWVFAGIALSAVAKREQN